MPDSTHPLNAELALYEKYKSQWLREYKDQFVVICGREIAGFYLDYAAAFKAGLSRFGISSQFLIKQICSAEPVYVVY